MNIRPKLTGTKKVPSLDAVGDTTESHARVLRQIVEVLNVQERRTKDVDSSFLRVSELQDMGLIEVKNNRVSRVLPGVIDGGEP